ncbi:hypothetical protein DID78_03760 [Candidatus Marinamargulisbacteria bacterium SCGC AG-343-D04]|nr:hypothetical protein DID78_03760 [Candidatus Marinamargulisbacteria bacterium SCGC AG-343-D04]
MSTRPAGGKKFKPGGKGWPGVRHSETSIKGALTILKSNSTVSKKYGALQTLAKQADFEIDGSNVRNKAKLCLRTNEDLCKMILGDFDDDYANENDLAGTPVPSTELDSLKALVAEVKQEMEAAGDPLYASGDGRAVAIRTTTPPQGPLPKRASIELDYEVDVGDEYDNVGGLKEFNQEEILKEIHGIERPTDKAAAYKEVVKILLGFDRPTDRAQYTDLKRDITKALNELELGSSDAVTFNQADVTTTLFEGATANSGLAVWSTYDSP